MPRARNPQAAGQLLEAAARIIADEGRRALTARRLASEVGASTMAVYTNFGSMEELLQQLLREGFVRFGEALDESPETDDPVADWIAQGWSYRRFALDNRNLYRVMFGERRGPVDDPADQQVAAATFTSLLERLRRAADAGRITVDDLELAGQVVWSMVHGHVTLELSGSWEAFGSDPEVAYAECMRRLALAYGDQPERLAASMTAARRRVGLALSPR